MYVSILVELLWNIAGVDFFALEHAPKDGFKPDHDEGWLHYIMGVVDFEKYRNHILRFMGSHANRYSEIIQAQENLERIYKERRIAEEKDKQERERLRAIQAEVDKQNQLRYEKQKQNS